MTETSCGTCNARTLDGFDETNGALIAGREDPGWSLFHGQENLGGGDAGRENEGSLPANEIALVHACRRYSLEEASKTLRFDDRVWRSGDVTKPAVSEFGQVIHRPARCFPILNDHMGDAVLIDGCAQGHDREPGLFHIAATVLGDIPGHEKDAVNLAGQGEVHVPGLALPSVVQVANNDAVP